MRIRILILALIVSSLSGVCQTACADQIFASEADFLNAAGPVITEDFESTVPFGTADGGGVLNALFFGFEVFSIVDSIKVPDFNYAGMHNTTAGGTNYLASDYDAGGITPNIRFELENPTNRIGFYVSDLDSLDMQVFIGSSSFLIPTTGNGGEAYFGVILDSEFDRVSLFIPDGADTAYALDDISIGAIPEPGSALLLGSACIFFIASRRNRLGVGCRLFRV